MSARLRAHYQNIERYESLLKTKLADLESQYLQRRIAEERFAIAMLQFMQRPTSDGSEPTAR